MSDLHGSYVEGFLRWAREKARVPDARFTIGHVTARLVAVRLDKAEAEVERLRADERLQGEEVERLTGALHAVSRKFTLSDAEVERLRAENAELREKQIRHIPVEESDDELVLREAAHPRGET